MKTTLLNLTFLLGILISAQCQISNKTQIEQALMAAPEAFREGAAVYGFSGKGEISMIRKGTNEMICLADDPTKEGFSVAAYHKNLDLFMKRGRELKEEGKGFQEVFDIREKEVRAGKLPMPDKATLIVLSGDFDADGNPINTHLRYVIYIPFATSESTGLPTGPMNDGGAWIMDPGTHRAHIMVTPPRKE